MSQEQQKHLVTQYFNMASGLYGLVKIGGPKVIQQRRGCPSTRGKKHSQGSTKRDPSAFEIVNDEIEKSSRRRRGRPRRSDPTVVKASSPERSPSGEHEDGHPPISTNPSSPLSWMLQDAPESPQLADEESLPSLDALPPPEEANATRKESVRFNLRSTATSPKSRLSPPAKRRKRGRPPKIGPHLVRFRWHVTDGLSLTLGTCFHQGGYEKEIHNVLIPYVDHVWNPPADGNCGFHCVVHAWGPRTPQFSGKWAIKRLRAAMLHNMREHEAYYASIFGGPSEVEGIMERLIIAPGAKVEKCNWLSKLDMGLVLANTLATPIVFWAEQHGETVVPSLVKPGSEWTPIHLGHVGSCHWILLNLKSAPNGVQPLPPIMAGWTSVKQTAAPVRRAWESILSPGLSHWQGILDKSK